MNVFTLFDIYLICSIVLFIVFKFYEKLLVDKSKTVLILKHITYCLITLLFCYFLERCLVVFPFKELNILVYIINICIFVCAASISWLWILFSVRFLDIDFSKSRQKKFAFVSIPYVINILLVLTNVFTNIYFSFDNYGNYHRGNGYVIFVVIDSFYVILALIITLLNRKNVSFKNFLMLFMLQSIPLTVGILETAFGVSLIWPVTSIAIVFLVIALATNLTETDLLTKTKLRSYLYKFFANSKSEDYSLAIVDIDDFREINFKFDRGIGDIVLASFAEALTANLPKDSFVIRLGGNTFLIYFATKNAQNVTEYLGLIDAYLDKFNKSSDGKYALAYSYAFRAFDKEYYRNFNDVIHVISKNMYENKLAKKLYAHVNNKKQEYISGKDIELFEQQKREKTLKILNNTSKVKDLKNKGS
ncbi:MAG: diguanylate cyclase [Clostridia bacterium]